MEKTFTVIEEGFFSYINNSLFAEKVPIELLANQYGTPLYLYSAGMIEERAEEFLNAFSYVNPLVCYSMKANANPAILSLLAKKKFGMDVVSGGELKQALEAGIPSEKIVYAGVGKSKEEISFAIAKDIFCFNVESVEELNLLSILAKKAGKEVSCNLRVNLDIDVDTHHYTKTAKIETKFGISIPQFFSIVANKERFSSVAIRGIHCHLGSQIKQAAPWIIALKKIKDIADKTSFTVEYLDLGGGMGIPYSPDEEVDSIQTFGKKVCPLIQRYFPDAKIIFEPGRFIVGNAGILLSRVIYPKQTEYKNFLILDAGMNDLIRPALYQSYHHIIPEKIPASQENIPWDVVGPICETSDFFGKDRLLPASLHTGDLIAICSTGAYGFSMSSNYNGRGRSAEVLVQEKDHRLIRKREIL
ncbi:MAG: diaminopimelate decarboxylase [Candidatus Ratteibacteria bacterium]|jgi:diaminopimelate decarboxylase